MKKKVIKAGFLSVMILIFSQVSAFSQDLYSNGEKRSDFGLYNSVNQTANEESVSESGFFRAPSDPDAPDYEPDEPGGVPVTDGLYVLFFLSLLYVCYKKQAKERLS